MARRHRTSTSFRHHTPFYQSISVAVNRIDREYIIVGAFVVAALLLSIRLFIVQMVEHGFYLDLASDQHNIVKSLLPKRGEIYTHDQFSESGLAVVATNRSLHHVYANPRQVENALPDLDIKSMSDAIAPILSLDSDIVLERLSKKNDFYEPLKHYVTDQEIEALQALVDEKKIIGIHWTPEESRFYPEGEITSALTGFVGMVDDKKTGQYGAEGYFDEILRGTPGSMRKELDAFGRFIAVGERSVIPAQDGEKIILTIDKNIQYAACSMLAEAMENNKGKRGSLIVLDPKTGAILALCSAPAFNPNNYSEVKDLGLFTNRALTAYEPGSVLKPIAMAAAINEKKVTPYSTYTDTGVALLGNHSVHNSDRKAHGVVDMTTVLELSLNTGAIYTVEQIGMKKWYEYMQAFGFGQKTGLTLNGESAGNILPIYDEGRFPAYAATSSYGQGITTTLLQLVQAYSAFANDGVIMRPYIVDRIMKPNGYQTVTEPEILSQPITAETAHILSAMLVRVVDDGHATRAAVPGYLVGGKTGTAQIPKEDGRGYDDVRHKDTFVGFISVSDPKIVAAVNIDEPETPWADVSAGPVFSKLAQYLVNYLHIQPDRTEEKNI